MCIMVSDHGLIVTQYRLSTVTLIAVITARAHILTREMMGFCTSVLFDHLLNLAQKVPANTGLGLIRCLNMEEKSVGGPCLMQHALC